MIMRRWKIQDRNNNSISFVAPSKTKAVEQYKRVFPGGRVSTVTDEGEIAVPHKIKISLPGVSGIAEESQVIHPVRREEKIGPNAPCPCGSGKKHKKCCLRKKGTVANK